MIGISCAGSKEEIGALVLDLANRAAAKLGHPADFTAEQIEVVDDYVGAGYGVPTPGMIEAVDLCARLEGLLIDPVYTGKAMSGLIGLVRSRPLQAHRYRRLRPYRRRAGALRL